MLRKVNLERQCKYLRERAKLDTWVKEQKILRDITTFPASWALDEPVPFTRVPKHRLPTEKSVAYYENSDDMYVTLCAKAIFDFMDELLK